MAALQYADVPGYHALLLRPSLDRARSSPGGLIELSHDWLADSKARWIGDTKTWRFPGRGRAAPAARPSRSATSPTATTSAATPAPATRSSASTSSPASTNTTTDACSAPCANPTAPTSAPPPTAPRLAQVPPRIRATSNPGGHGHELGQEPVRRPRHPPPRRRLPALRARRQPPPRPRHLHRTPSASSRPPNANGSSTATGRSPTTANCSTATGST